jgi:hypothetical protein
MTVRHAGRIVKVEVCSFTGFDTIAPAGMLGGHECEQQDVPRIPSQKPNSGGVGEQEESPPKRKNARRRDAAWRSVLMAIGHHEANKRQSSTENR